MPPAPFEHLAQYNEVTVGAAVYDAALEMGAGDARAGFRMLLRALSGFAARHHPPRDLREVRDALIEDGGIETTGAQTQAIGDAFARQNIAWGYLQGAVVPVVDNVRTEVQARVTGPATCIKAREGDPNDPDLRIAFYGPLGFTHHDDCFSWADGDPFDEGDSNDGAVQWDLPYLPGQGHRSGEFTASLRYTCVPLDDPCPAVLNVAWSATTLSWLASEPLFSEAAMLRAWAQRDLILRRDEWLDVARFDARGRCTTIPGGTSCGT